MTSFLELKIGKKLVKLLSNYSLYSAENLIALAKGDIEQAIELIKCLAKDSKVSVPSNSVDKLRQGLFKLKPMHYIQSAMGLPQATGYAIQKSQSGHVQSLNIAGELLNLPKKVGPIDAIELLVKDQGNLGICVAAAVTRALEVHLNMKEPLSMGFLYRGCKSVDGSEDSPGTTLQAANEVIQSSGVCREALYPTSSISGNSLSCCQEPNEIAIQDAKKHRIYGSVLFDEKTLSIEIVKAAVSGALFRESRTCIAAMKVFSGMEVLSHPQTDAFLPEKLPNENGHGYHAVLVVGYADDDAAPGGGRIHCTNSYGESYGEKGRFWVSYEYFLKHCISLAIPLIHEHEKGYLDSLGNMPPQLVARTLKAGFSIGKDPEGSPVYLNHELASNRHMVVVGKSGCGKSEFLKHFVENKAPTGTSIHVFDAHNEYDDLLVKVSSINAIDTGLPFTLLSNQRKLPVDLFIDGIVAEIAAVTPNLGRIQCSELSDLLTNAYELKLDNRSLKEYLVANASNSLKAQLQPLLLVLRSNKKILNGVTVGTVTVHRLQGIDRPESRAAYMSLTSAFLLDSKLADKHAIESVQYLILEESSRLRKSRVIIERMYKEARKQNIGVVFCEQELKDIPVVVLTNAATRLFWGEQAPKQILGDRPTPQWHALVQSDGKTKLVSIAQRKACITKHSPNKLKLAMSVDEHKSQQRKTIPVSVNFPMAFNPRKPRLWKEVYGWLFGALVITMILQQLAIWVLVRSQNSNVWKIFEDLLGL